MKITGWLLLILLIGLVGGYFLVSFKSDEAVFSKIDEVPPAKVAVLLGTSRYLSNGKQNLYFKYRMDAATELFRKGKVEYILVSGDNSERSYNEPRAMRQALIERGIPPERIVLDFAGFRTLDSMVRAREVFGQQNFIVVSQEFHNQRAVFIARAKGIDAVGFNARDVEVSAGLRTRLREVFARGKMLLDLYVLNTQPKFLGEEVKIGES